MIYVIVKSGKSDEPVVRKQFTFYSRLRKIVDWPVYEDYRVVNCEMNVYDCIHLEFANGCHIYQDYSDLKDSLLWLLTITKTCGVKQASWTSPKAKRLLHLQRAALQELQLGQNDETLLQKIRSAPKKMRTLHKCTWNKNANAYHFSCFMFAVHPVWCYN